MSCSGIDVDELDENFSPYGLPAIPVQDQKEIWNARMIQALECAHSLLQIHHVVSSILHQKADSYFSKRLIKDYTFDHFEDLEDGDDTEWELALAQPFYLPNCAEGLTVEQLLEQRGMIFDRELGQYIDCRSWIKRMAHSAEKKVRRACKKTIAYVKEHKKEIAIAAGVAVATYIAYQLVPVAVDVVLAVAEEILRNIFFDTDKPSFKRQEYVSYSTRATLHPEQSALTSATTDLPTSSDMMKQVFGNIFPIKPTIPPHHGFYRLDVENPHREHTSVVPSSTFSPRAEVSPQQFYTPGPSGNIAEQFFNNMFQANPHLNPYASPGTVYKTDKSHSDIPTAQPQSAESAAPTSHAPHPFKSDFGKYLDSLQRNQIHSLNPIPFDGQNGGNSTMQKNEAYIAPAPDISASSKNAFTNFMAILSEGLKTIGRGMSDPELLQSETALDIFNQEYAKQQNSIETSGSSFAPTEGPVLQNPVPQTSLGFLNMLAKKFEAIGYDSEASDQEQNRSNFFKTMAQTLRNGMETMGRGMCEPEILEFHSPLDPLKGPIESVSPPPEGILNKVAETISRGLEIIAQVHDPRLIPLGLFNAQFELPLKTALSSFLESIAHSPATIDPIMKYPLYDTERSRSYKTDGIDIPGMRLTCINGMDNPFNFAKRNAEHIQSLTPNNMRIHGIYNHSNGKLCDGLEIGFLNYPGYSPKTEGLLIEDWREFHEINKDNPHAKIMHFCHSQGAIHTKNALMELEEEIRNRIIVVALAPAEVIPRRLCYASYNYASKKDYVPLAPLLFAALYGAISAHSMDDEERNAWLNRIAEEQQQIIWLEPHEGAGWLDLDHACQSPTFTPLIEKHCKDYDIHKGVYK